MVTTPSQQLSRLRELDAKRTQGKWIAMSSDTRYEYSVYAGVDKEGDWIYVCHRASKPDRNFIASAPDMMRLIEWQVGALKQAREALNKCAYPNLHLAPIDYSGGIPYDAVTLGKSKSVARDALALTDPESGEL